MGEIVIIVKGNITKKRGKTRGLDCSLMSKMCVGEN